MASHGIRDRVAVVGMGCTPFGEHWGRGVADLVRQAVAEAVSGAGVTVDDVDAWFVGTLGSGTTGATVTRPLGIDAAPATRVENYCGSGTDAFRHACYAVAAGAADVAVAVGVEKLKDNGFSGLVLDDPPGDGSAVATTAPGVFSMVAQSYLDRWGIDRDGLRAALSHIAASAHRNGAANPLAAFRHAVPPEAVTASRPVAGMLHVLDCSGVSDGASAAVVVRSEDAHRYGRAPLYVKGLSVVSGSGHGVLSTGFDYTTNDETALAAADALAQAGVTDARGEIGMVELHDCFTPNVLVLLEALTLSAPGTAWKEVLDGVFDLDGEVAVNPDGGLTSFGHPIGASGLRMLYECGLQLGGDERAAARRVRAIAEEGRTLAMTHNAGGGPGEAVAFVTIVGSERS